MPNQVCPDTGKVISCFFNVFLAYRDGHIFILYDRVRPGRFVIKHFVIFFSVFIQTVINGFAFFLRHRD